MVGVTTYSTEVADKICARITDGESVRGISRDPDMPAMSTIFLWLRDNEDFQRNYAIAKQECAEAMVEDMLDIADNVAQPVLDKDGNLVLDADGKPLMMVDAPSVNHARLRVDTRKWAASHLKPKKYGDRQQIDHSIPEGVVFNMNFGGKPAKDGD